MAKTTLRFAEIDDANELLQIYAPYVEQTAITFEYDVATVAEFSKKNQKHQGEVSVHRCGD